MKESRRQYFNLMDARALFVNIGVRFKKPPFVGGVESYGNLYGFCVCGNIESGLLN
jgi:hypothetical protein